MSELNIPFKKGLFGFKPEKVMDYVDELLRNSDFDQIKISELEKKIASYDDEIAKRDSVIAEKNNKIAELESEIETAKNNEAVGVKCTECDVQKKAESLLGETLFDVKRFSLYLVNDAKQKANTTISEAKGTAGVVSTQAKEILYNVDDISTSFSSQIEELRTSLSGLTTRLDAFCTGISSVVESPVEHIKKPENNSPSEDKVLTDIKAEIYSELPPDVIEGINSLNGSDKKYNGNSSTEINETSHTEIPESCSFASNVTDNSSLSENYTHLINSSVASNDTVSDAPTISINTEVSSNTTNSDYCDKTHDDRDTEVYISDQENILAVPDGLHDSVTSDYDFSYSNNDIKVEEPSFVPEPFSLENAGVSVCGQIPSESVRNDDDLMPGMVSPFADLFGSEYTNATENSSVYSDTVPSIDTHPFKNSNSDSELPVFDTEQNTKTDKDKDKRDRNFTYVNKFKMKPNLNSSDSPIPSDPLPTDFE